jgi:type IV pilus assembly protein PilB
MAPVVQLLNSIIADAAKARATDIHIEPQQADVRVRYRVDGVLREVSTLPLWLRAAMLSRLKIVCGMDIAERRRPQDGRARVTVDGRPIDVRVSTIATMHGEKAVVRLLPDPSGEVPLDQLGLTDDQLGPVERHLAMPQGLILFTGPTGSGKTTSMYAVLHRLASPERNVTTLEDPIEYQMHNVNQIQIDEKTGLTFATGLRTVLRQDPDVILVGEIRDAETARICVQSAMTGHLVFSTLHTNDAASAVTRLADIGIEPFLISSSLSLVVAQRLLRRVCPSCRRPVEPSERTLKLLGVKPESLAGVQLVSGAGCSACGHTGYQGRVGVYEVLEVTPSLRERIAAGASPAVLTVAARAQGMRILREVALEKAFAGETTLDEVLRATRIDLEEARHCVTCGRGIEAAFVSCPYCMTALNPRACPSCSRPVEPGWKGCPYCGGSLGTVAGVGGGPAGDAGSRPRLLLVEDDRATALRVRTMLEPEFDVTAAHAGSEAIEKATTTMPEIMLLDLGLPDMPGTEVLRSLRELPAARDLLIVVLTAADDHKSEIECLEAGVDDFLHKPVVEDVLRARLAALLRRRAAHAS